MLTGVLLSLAVTAAADPPAALPPAVTAPAPAAPAPTATPTPTAAAVPTPAVPADPLLDACRVGPPDQCWFAGGPLLYRFQSAPLPTLVVVDGGRLPADATGFGWASGIHLAGGRWLNDRHTVGVALGGFLTEHRAGSLAVGDAGGSRVITRPFTDALTGAPSAFFVATPGRLTGGFRADSTARLASGTAAVVRNLAYDRGYTVDATVGFRYLDLHESLKLTQTTTAVPPGILLLNGDTIPGGVPLTITDRFGTRNQFYGGELGVRSEARYGPAFLAVAASVGLGSVHQRVTIAGSSVAQGVAAPAGFLAVAGGNAGTSTASRLGVLTVARVEGGTQLTRHLRFLVGYDFLYLNETARPGQQIDPVVNTRLVPTTRNFGAVSGVASPVRLQAPTDFFAHGVRFAFEIQF